MTATSEALAQLLALTALIGATIEYAAMLKRRLAARREAALREESGHIGLQGLVRVFLANSADPRPTMGNTRHQPE